MCFALFMIMLDNTVVNVALPSIQRDLHATLSALEWTVNAYTLTFAVLLVTGGRLGDIFGRRRMFLFGVVVFGLSSAAIGFAPNDSDAGRVPGRPGHRRRVHDAGDAVDHHPGVPAPPARDRDRHLGWGERAGAGHRPGARRLPDPAGELARDLLHQSADRPDRGRRDAVRGPRVPRRDGQPQGRRPRHRDDHDQPDGARPGAGGGQLVALGLGARGVAAGGRGASAWPPSWSPSCAARRRWSTSGSSARGRSWARTSSASSSPSRCWPSSSSSPSTCRTSCTTRRCRPACASCPRRW